MQPYPEPQESWQNSKVEESMQLADTVIRAVRKLRNDYGLQRQRPELFIQVVTAVPSVSIYEFVQQLICCCCICRVQNVLVLVRFSEMSNICNVNTFWALLLTALDIAQMI